MLELIFNMFLQCFTCVYDSLNRIEIADGISLWTWLIVCFVAFGVLGVVLREFGFGFTKDSVDATARVIRDTRSSKEG